MERPRWGHAGIGHGRWSRWGFKDERRARDAKACTRHTSHVRFRAILNLDGREFCPDLPGESGHLLIKVLGLSLQLSLLAGDEVKRRPSAFN